MGIQNKIDNRLTGRKPMRRLRFSSMMKKRFFNHARKWKTDFFFDDARGTIVTGRMSFFRLGGGIFEGGKQNPSDFASDSGKILMDGGYAEASADICIVEAAEAEILRDAKTDCAAGEENQLGDAVNFRQ